MPVFIMKSVLPQSEFYGWVLYLRDKPPSIQEQQMAVLSTIAANSLGGKSKVDDFILSKIDKQPKSPQREATAFDSFNAVARDFKPPTTS